MASTEQLLVRIDATTEQLRRELKRADDAVARNSRTMDRALTRVDKGFARFNRAASSAAKAAGAFGLALGGVAITNFVRGQLDAADAMGKAARTASVSTDQLQELRFAFGQLAGTTDRQVDEALRRFNRRLGEGQNGSKEYADALQDLGVDLRQDTAPALEDVLRRLSQVESDSERARIAAKLFGEDAGPKLAAALNDGGQAMVELRERAREMGIVLDKAAIKKAEEINDRFDVASRVLGTQFKNAVVALTPALLSLAEAFGTAAENWKEFLNIGEENAIEQQILRLASQRDQILTALQQQPPDVIAETLRTELQSVNAELLELQRQLQGLRGGGGGSAQVGRPARAPDLPPLGAVQQPRGPGAVQRARGPGRAITARPSGFDFEGVDVPPGIFRDEDAERIGRNLDEFRAGVDAITEAQRRMGEAGRDVTLTLLDGLNRAIVAGDSFREVLAGVLSQLSRMAVNNPGGLGSLITTGLGALGGGGFNAGASVRAVGTSGQLAGLATGGSFMVGGSGGVDSQLVAFRASPNERVTVETPGQQRGGGGMKIEQHIHIAAGNGDQALAALVERAAERGGRRGYELMAQDITHGGPLGKRLR